MRPGFLLVAPIGLAFLFACAGPGARITHYQAVEPVRHFDARPTAPELVTRQGTGGATRAPELDGCLKIGTIELEGKEGLKVREALSSEAQGRGADVAEVLSEVENREVVTSRRCSQKSPYRCRNVEIVKTRSEVRADLWRCE
jgi:hypothetical protein